MTTHNATTASESATDSSNETHLSFDHPPRSPFPVLPSYEEAVGVKDVARLPSYRQSRPPPRVYHPYQRRAPALVDGTGIDSLMNTIYDEERIDVVAPPALARGPPPVQPLVPTPLPVRRGLHAWPFDIDNVAGNALDDELRQADIIEFDHRMRELPEVILQDLMTGTLPPRQRRIAAAYAARARRQDLP